MDHEERHPVERALATSPLVPRDGVVIVAVSGGADSMALVDALRRGLGDDAIVPRRDFRSAIPNVSREDHERRGTIASAAMRAARRIVVAHLDHRLRADSVRDAEHVAAYARAHGLELVLGSEDVGRRARAERRSLEEAGRDARYAFLERTAEDLGASCVVTAHTRSDQVETVFMRIARGAGRVGGAGIPERRGLFVRPLLCVTRAETRDYCRARGVAFVDDPSNVDRRFLRNRVRMETLPALRAVFPRIDENLIRIAENARREQQSFAGRAEAWLRRNVRAEASGVWTIRLSGFASCDDEDAAALLREALAHAGLARDVGRVHYRRLLELMRDAHAGSSADLPGFHARREHDAVVLCTARGWHGDPAAGSRCDETLLRIPGRTRALDWIIDADIVDPDHARRLLARRDTGAAYFDAEKLAGPLFARARRPGDAMRPFGMNGRKKLSDLFVDRKIPRRRRDRVIVIEGGAIYWVPGVAASELGRVGAETERVVRLRARPAGGRP